MSSHTPPRHSLHGSPDSPEGPADGIWRELTTFERHCRAKGHSLSGRPGDKLGLTTASLGKAVAPAGAAVVSFHGDRLPPDVMHGRHGRRGHAPFVGAHWHL